MVLINPNQQIQLPVSNLTRTVPGFGPLDAKILLLIDVPGINDEYSKRPLSDYIGNVLFSQFYKAGIRRGSVRVETICQRVPPGGKFYALDPHEQSQWKLDCLDRIRRSPANIIVPLGETALRLVGLKSNINKWHLSILEGIDGRKVVGLLDPRLVLRTYKDLPFLTFGAVRVVEESLSPKVTRTERKFILNPSVDDALRWMDEATKEEWLSVDIETGAGQITCVGFSTNPNSALCIPTLPKDYNSLDYHRMFSGIVRLLKSPIKKLGQNFIYDKSYFALYGIEVNNFVYDTMVAQKVLHPELPMGLDTIARIYTREPYWKDDGKDWGVRQDINQLYRYNCLDAAGTLEAAFAQMVDLEQRGLTKVFNRIMTFDLPACEMSWTGLPIDQTERTRLQEKTRNQIEVLETRLNQTSQTLINKDINARSHIQVKELLKASGYRVPTKQGKETSDLKALMKLQIKHTGSKILPDLIAISKLNKMMSSYLNVKVYPDDRLRFTMRIHGTETGRWSCSKDPWDYGLNAQTLPKNLKSMILAKPGTKLIEIDLRQAESRFVAWDGPVPKLQQMYRDNIDVHKYVASHPLLCNKPIDQITDPERQLGKTAGHAANYGVRGATLAEQCLMKLNHIITASKGDRMLQGYHEAFDGQILNWQDNIRTEVTQNRKLFTPFDRERYFYGRPGPDLDGEAFAYRPQSSVLDVCMYLMLHVFGQPGVTLINQVHDSIVLEVMHGKEKEIIERVKDQNAWNPVMKLRGGELRIPIEIKMGKRLSELEEIYCG